jgi:hypothetical protein
VAAFVQSALSADLYAALQTGELTQAEFDAALKRQDYFTNKADVGLAFANTLSDHSNLNPATDTSTIAGLKSDHAYQASIAILAGVTNDDQSKLDAIALINDAADETDPIDFILKKTGVKSQVGISY